MSSFIKAQKSNQKVHRERKNVLSNGFLERKKDYKARSNEYNRRKEILSKLRKKALDKNPDEFFFRMKSSKLIDGVHYDIRKDDDELQPEELQLMQTQDLNYINYKHSIDRNKVEKLRGQLHWLDSDPERPKNNHIIFVENRKQKKFEQNRLEAEAASSHRFRSDKDDNSDEVKELKYRRLRNKIDREQFLRLLATKMQIKKQLLNKNEKAIKIKKGRKNSAPVYQWKMERKK